MEISAPKPTVMNGLIFGIVVLKLLAAMNEEKHAPGNDEIASAIIKAFAVSAI